MDKQLERGNYKDESEMTQATEQKGQIQEESFKMWIPQPKDIGFEKNSVRHNIIGPHVKSKNETSQ